MRSRSNSTASSISEISSALSVDEYLWLARKLNDVNDDVSDNVNETNCESVGAEQSNSSSHHHDDSKLLKLTEQMLNEKYRRDMEVIGEENAIHEKQAVNKDTVFKIEDLMRKVRLEEKKKPKRSLFSTIDFSKRRTI